jgi:hypothetical protein
MIDITRYIATAIPLLTHALIQGKPEWGRSPGTQNRRRAAYVVAWDTSRTATSNASIATPTPGQK